MFRSSKLCLALAPLLVLAACGGEGNGGKDADVDPVDAANNDATVDDAAVPDAAVVDAAVADADVTDAGEADAAAADAGEADAGAMDAAPDDAMAEMDAMPMDAGAGTGVLIISEIADGDLSGGQPKFVEITNVGDGPVDLSQYSLGIYANANTTLVAAALVLSGTLAAGDSYVLHLGIGSPATDFSNVYGFAADVEANFSLNGDDTIALFLGAATGDGSDATLVDLYGSVGTDGTGQPWEYLDGYAVRLPTVTTPSPTLVEAEWTIANGALDGLDAAGHAATTSPGTHTVDP